MWTPSGKLKVAFEVAQMWSDKCALPSPPRSHCRKAKGEGSWGRGAQVVCWQNVCVVFPPQINALSLLLYVPCELKVEDCLHEKIAEWEVGVFVKMQMSTSCPWV